MYYQPPYLAFLNKFHLLEETIMFIFQLSSLFIYLQSSIMSTSLSEDCAVCGKSFKRLGAHLVRGLACFLIACHAGLTQAVICQKALIMAPVQI
jgi:hypothetical protein